MDAAHVHQAGLLTVGGRRPLGAAICAGAHENRRGLERCKDRRGWVVADVDRARLRNERIANRVRLRRRRILFGDLRHQLFVDADEWRAALPIEQVHPASLASLSETFDGLAIHLHVEQHIRTDDVVVPDVVVDLLEVPLAGAGLGIQRHDGLSEQVVTRARTAIQVRRRVANGHVQHAQVGIECRRLPHRPAAELPHIRAGRPRVVAEFARAGDGEEAPHLLARVRIVGSHMPADLILRAGDANEYHAVPEQWRHCLGIASAWIVVLHAPGDLARARVERRQLGVELTDEHLAATEANAAIDLTAAERQRGNTTQLGDVPPHLITSGRFERVHLALRSGDVHRPVDDDGRALEGGRRAVAADVIRPGALEIGDVARFDLIQRRVALVEEVAAVDRPVVASGIAGRWRGLIGRYRARDWRTHEQDRQDDHRTHPELTTCTHEVIPPYSPDLDADLDADSPRSSAQCPASEAYRGRTSCDSLVLGARRTRRERLSGRDRRVPRTAYERTISPFECQSV